MSRNFSYDLKDYDPDDPEQFIKTLSATIVSPW